MCFMEAHYVINENLHSFMVPYWRQNLLLHVWKVCQEAKYLFDETEVLFIISDQTDKQGSDLLKYSTANFVL